MKLIKIAGVAWGLIYLAVGAIKSFTFNSNDTWASVALLFALFFLPLPITAIAVWFPRAAGRALLGCVAISVVAASIVVITRRTYPLSDIGRFIVFIVSYDIPHLFFGVAYSRAGQASKNFDAGDKGSSLGFV